MDNFMKMAKEAAENGMNLNEGGPFGAVITDKNGNVISVGNNQVLKNNDPTAHAEVMIYLIVFCIHLASLVQCVYLLQYGQTLKMFIMPALAKMLLILALEMILFMNI